LLRLKSFKYFEPSTIADAIGILMEQGRDAHPLAGGTDLLVRMKREQINTVALINLKRIEGLDHIRRTSDGQIQIGALTPISAIKDSPLIRSSHEVLAQAAGVLGSPSIRNIATLGGNVGRASPASDMVPPLIVLKACVAVQGSQGSRELPIEDLFISPGRTSLAAGELITSFSLPVMPPETAAVYRKIGRREAVDLAIVGAAVLLRLRGENDIAEARIGLASVGPTPLRAQRAEAELLSGPLTQARVEAASRAAMSDCFPISDIRASSSYRREMVRVLVKRSLHEAAKKVWKGKVD